MILTKSIISRWLLSNYTAVKTLTFWKVSFQTYNFGVRVYKGIILPWMKWNPSVQLYKLSLPEEWVWKAYNFGFPVNKGVIPPWIKWNPSFHDDY